MTQDTVRELCSDTRGQMGSPAVKRMVFLVILLLVATILIAGVW